MWSNAESGSDPNDPDDATYFKSDFNLEDELLYLSKQPVFKIFSPLLSFTFNIHGDSFPFLSTSFACPSGSTVSYLP